MWHKKSSDFELNTRTLTTEVSEMPTLQFATDTQESKRLALLHKKGTLHRIRRGIYIDSEDKYEVAKVIENNWHQIAAYLYEGSIAIARTAAEGKPASGRVYLATDKVTKERVVKVDGLELSIEPGNSKLAVEPFVLDMKRSSHARYLLENLKSSRGEKKRRKTLGPEWVESDLVRTVGLRGEAELNEIRDEANGIAPELNLEKEFTKLNKMISAILTTHPADGVLQTGVGIAHAKGEPFDPIRIGVLKSLANYLIPLKLTENAYKFEKSAWRNLSFFESYFSNYIEGTEFTIEEAEAIVFNGDTIKQRHEDSHDVRAHMDITRDMSEMSKVPSSAVKFIDILKTRHSILMAERTEKRPGEFKEKMNKAGNTVFVSPNHVEGTLVQGFEIYQQIPHGIQRAIFMHFLVSECHPFDDGNGRLSRIMMNAELVSEKQFKIIVPTVHRDSYLLGLRNATRGSRFRASIKVLHQLQCYTASLDWSDYGEVKDRLLADMADKDPDEGVATFNKAICNLGDEYPAG